MIGFLSEPVFLALFGIAFIGSAVYLLSIMKLGEKVRDLKRRGRAAEAPVLSLSGSADVLAGLAWLVQGRYGMLGDEPVALWARRARVLLFVLLPLDAVLFASVFAHILAPSGSGSP